MQALLYRNRISSVNPFASKQMKAGIKESGKRKENREKHQRTTEKAAAARARLAARRQLHGRDIPRRAVRKEEERAASLLSPMNTFRTKGFQPRNINNAICFTDFIEINCRL